ncbi:hydantoinase B/oxoprolinase family protein [Baekduia soli]|nr:hydantoinase B/oxoprolinase family protein [Baekduia soli]
MSVDTVTLEIIENTLRGIRHEMDAVMFRTSLSPVIRETHDTYPLVADRDGRMLVGQFGSHLASFLDELDEDLAPGDVILQNDPYLCGGSISHVPDLLVTRPVFHEGELVGFTAQFGNLLDVGGTVFGSMPTSARSIFEEGIRFPPVKLYEAGVLNRSLVKVLARNSRAPEEAVADLMALCTATALGERRVVELCDRFGRDVYLEAGDLLLERTRAAVQRLIVDKLPTSPQAFEDFVDDDGRGNGPFRIKLAVWREDDRAIFDFAGTSPQAPGPINFYLHDGMMKMVIGVYLIMVFDPDVLFNEGFYDLIEIRIEDGTLLRPRYPAPLGIRHSTMSRWIDVIAGALGRHVPETAAAAGYGSSPHLLYSGTTRAGETFGMLEIFMGGIPARPAGDGLDAHSWYPQLENTPGEYQETYYPVIVEESGIVPDSGGAGYHRGGCGVRKIVRFLEPGELSMFDDRHVSHPWGIGGGRHGGRSRKELVRADGEREALPAKVDFVEVGPGDVLIYETAGAGGWGDPLQRPVEWVLDDVAKGFVSQEAALDHYGVVLDDLEATRRLRSARARAVVPLFDFGPRPPGYEATLDVPERAPLGAAEAIEPRSIDVGLLDSRE